MAFLARARKIELLEICEELGIEANTSMKIVELKTSILSYDKYDEEEVKYMVERISEDRIKREEEERIGREYKIKQEEEERKERMIREAHQHELELKKLEISKDLNQKNENETKTEVSHKIQLTQITPKFDEKHDEMGLYLINFERRAEMAEVPKKNWVAYLLAVLPAELSNMLAREEPNDANNYEFVKKLILKRYKLNSEKLKQCFYRHHKSVDKSWRNYVQELYSYFTEWITELKIGTFQQLKDLIVTEQLKFRVPAEIRDHYLEDWMTFKTPYELAEKIDDFESIKDSFKITKIPHDEIENKNAKAPFWEKKNYDGNKFNASIKAKPSWNNSMKINKVSSAVSSLRMCLFCKDEHEPENCSLTPEEKKQKLKESNRCFLCYELNCRRTCRQNCDICSSPFHGTLLHINFKRKENDVPNDILTARIVLVDCKENGEIKSRLPAIPTTKVKIESNVLDAIVDSGTQISVVKENLVPEKWKTPHGNIVLMSAFGEKIKVPLINLPMTKCEDELIFEEPSYITCAMVPKLTNDLLLSTSALKELNRKIGTMNVVKNEIKSKMQECKQEFNALYEMTENESPYDKREEFLYDIREDDDFNISMLYDCEDELYENDDTIKGIIKETMECCENMSTINENKISCSEILRNEQGKEEIKHVHANEIRESKETTNDDDANIYDTHIGDPEKVSKIALRSADTAQLNLIKKTDITETLRKHDDLSYDVPRMLVSEVEVCKPVIVPKMQKYFRISNAAKKEVICKIKEWLQLGQIVPIESKCSPPYVGMKDCADDKHLNDQFVISFFPMENMTDLIHHVFQAKYLPLIDCPELCINDVLIDSND